MADLVRNPENRFSPDAAQMSHCDKSKHVGFAPNEDPDQLGNQQSLIIVFTVCMKEAKALSCPFSVE